MRLWTPNEDGLYGTSRILLGGQRDTWLSCRPDGHCLRHDDGTLLLEPDEGGRLRSVPPQGVRHPPKLELDMASALSLETIDGESTAFTVRVRNAGTHRAFWINVRRTDPSSEDDFVFHPPPTWVILEPGDVATLECRVSTHSGYEDPRGGESELRLVVTSLDGEPIPVEPIRIRSKTPSLEWEQARWSRDGDELVLSMTLENSGEQVLKGARFQPRLVGHEDLELLEARPTFIQPGSQTRIPVPLPGDFKPSATDRVTLTVPYQTGGGARKESIFFGRQELLTHVLTRDPANYLLVGGRQLGKSTLLKALERRYRDQPQVTCHYLVLADAELPGELARALGLPRESGLDAVAAHLAEAGEGRHVLLIDEADVFVRAEHERGYPTLARLRSLSEEGRCHFILAGFWDLHEAVTFDYQSPLRNFGETLTLGALEAEACRELATRPMATISISYESPELVERLVKETGQRANLIAIACNELLKGLGLEQRTLTAEQVDRALESRPTTNALAGWKELTGTDNPSGNRLDRLLVYATIERESFSLGEALGILEELGESVSPDRVERSLERLELAFVLGKDGTRYSYRVPIFKKRVLAQEPKVLLSQELKSGG